ncbi:EscU/YscU/HrcU family type III secretion system export apparatus switch protein [Larsenimonas rhizosphaerae]|uniref:Flagellar biosynthetic protein FlhB n=1 Tax=Larsenimonas rhizosphaerae TaxID=2944682 RepID=A0AA41ZF83_9GAMM|nr:EscU/YscU/HrcU family type III secretion system export apparatus switch protein [Larsenimonas rhizosphaerae]MCM2130111.1 EscU/YscU/HrcU family type III secretion system export apparatus switch protein [Larsenimonas rhizosphaerae]MCX2522798.1 EscU/YscU/HrcU family type III secretion system export apparatus switch protein [Larsenimonas rhizosphaerae]
MSEEQPAPQARAAAISYGAGDAAPRVVAKGYGSTAQAILERAEENGLYVHHSAELVDLLMKVDLDERIPAALYQAIAELLAWVYALEEGFTTLGQAARDEASREG